MSDGQQAALRSINDGIAATNGWPWLVLCAALLAVVFVVGWFRSR